ncbi:hypothetical protein NRB49_27215, partial [Klebsiella pneumoniae]|uniref:hypothetical protein n=1 Tax=Klebsiella pneumoniae TaxID=573 RepID=UPI00211D50DA
LKIFTGIQPAKTLSCGFLLRPFSFCFPRLRLSHGTGPGSGFTGTVGLCWWIERNTKLQRGKMEKSGS